jgi:hypothetical protein
MSFNFISGLVLEEGSNLMNLPDLFVGCCSRILGLALEPQYGTTNYVNRINFS